LVRNLLGKTVPRRQSLDAWDKLAQEVLEKVRKDGVPRE
jgi:hypothetical protein